MKKKNRLLSEKVKRFFLKVTMQKQTLWKNGMKNFHVLNVDQILTIPFIMTQNYVVMYVEGNTTYKVVK